MNSRLYGCFGSFLFAGFEWLKLLQSPRISLTGSCKCAATERCSEACDRDAEGKGVHCCVTWCVLNFVLVLGRLLAYGPVGCLLCDCGRKNRLRCDGSRSNISSAMWVVWFDAVTCIFLKWVSGGWFWDNLLSVTWTLFCAFILDW